MKLLKFENLPQGGFAGLRERQLVIDAKMNRGRPHSSAASGLGNFVYMADANFLPHGETGMHPHREVDVISVMIDGRVKHAGSLKHGQQLDAGTVQVQRAGGEGFTHNEINPDGKENQMIQLWVLPETSGERAGYKVYQPQSGQRERIYGGKASQNKTFASSTLIDVAKLKAGQELSQSGEVMAYLVRGSALINGQKVHQRTLVRATDFEFRALKDSHLILIYME